MSTSTETIETYATRKETGSSNAAGFFKRLVRSKLAELSSGQLTVRDGEETTVYGSPSADGLTADITIVNQTFYKQLALAGSIGGAEAFIQGWWQTSDLTRLIRLFARNLEATDKMEKRTARIGAQIAGLFHKLRRNTKDGSKKNIQAHYDLSNEFFALFLDKSMTYSAGVFEHPDSTLEVAQKTKLDRICSKLCLSPSDHVLEIGTGWGSFAIHAAKNYGCKVTTTTISEKQRELAEQRVRAAGLEDRIEIVLKDYRDLNGKFDKLVSIEMIEAVGHEFLETYFKACSDLLKPDGMMALQVITIADQRYDQLRRTTDFIQRYIFPGSLLPSIAIMSQAVAKVTDLRVTHLDDMTPHYAHTLRLWHDRFNQKIESVRKLGYTEEFIRMWHYYLSYCEAGFQERCTGSIQLVLSKPQCREASIFGDPVAAASQKGAR